MWPKFHQKQIDPITICIIVILRSEQPGGVRIDDQGEVFETQILAKAPEKFRKNPKKNKKATQKNSDPPPKKNKKIPQKPKNTPKKNLIKPNKTPHNQGSLFWSTGRGEVGYSKL